MRFNWFTAFSLVGILSKWLSKSMEDGRITLAETVELLLMIAPILGLDLDDDVLSLKNKN